MTLSNVKNEEEVATGRSDIVIEYGNRVAIIELKLDKTAKEAIEQIREKGYYKKYEGKDVVLIGVNIDSEKRSITEWEAIKL